MSKYYKKVSLDKNKDYVFCFLKEKIIVDCECDMYLHNMKCDRNKDFWGRTHQKGSNSGIHISGEGAMLNECNYCLEDHQKNEYVLSYEATSVLKKNNKSSNTRLLDKVKEFFMWE